MGNWNFNDTELAENFDYYVREHVHYYSNILRHTLDIAEWFLPRDRADRAILDFGCGSGELLEQAMERFENLDCYGVDNSHEMVEACVARGLDKVGLNLNVTNRSAIPVVIANLVLQFNTPAMRRNILRDLYSRTALGGVIIVTEKVQSEFVQSAAIQRQILHDHKFSKGVSPKTIYEKESSLVGVLKAQTVNDNIQEIRDAGYREVELMFKYGEFCMFMGIKK